MTAEPVHLSNELPRDVAAVLIHRAHVAMAAEQRAKAARRLAEQQAERAGVPIGGLRRARRWMTADPKRLEQQAQEDAFILTATRSGVQVEQPTLFEATTDQSDEARDRRLHDEGYSAAVWCQPRDGGGYDDEPDVAAWNGGYDAFSADLAAFEIHEQQQRRAK